MGNENKVEQFINYCGLAEEDLTKLKDLLGKVIENKEKIVKDNSKKAFIEQSKNILQTIENLKEIGSKIPGKIEEVRILLEKATKLYRKEFIPGEHSILSNKLMPGERKEEIAGA